MGTFVTPQGFVRKPYQDIKSEIQQGMKRIFGEEFDLNPDSPNGYLTAMLALLIDRCYSMGEDVFSSLVPQSAEGTSLDNILSYSGLTRKEASKMHGKVMLYCDGTNVTVPSGTAVIRTRGNVRLTSQSSVSLGASAMKSAYLTVSGSGDGTGTFVFSFGTFTTTATTPSAALVDINAQMASRGTPVSHSIVGSDTLYLYSENPFSVSSLPSYVTTKKYGNDGEFVADEAGYETAEPDEVNALETTISHVVLVRNVEALVSGSDEESDASARLRFILYNRNAGNVATEKAIETHLLNDVNGVTFARVTSNRTNGRDAAGRPAKSFEAVVVGGDDDKVAECIFNTQGVGVESYGSTSVVVTDGNGDEQLVRFSRPVAAYLWIKLVCHRYTEEDIGSDASARIKSAIVEWAGTEYGLGKDILVERIKAPVFNNVSGIGSIDVQVAVVDDAGTVPLAGDYVSTDIPLDGNRYAVVGASSISVSIV